MIDLTDKVAIVTGASRGIGAAIAKSLGAAGAAVVVNYATSREAADRVVADIARRGGKAIAVQGDVSKSDDVKRLFAETKKAFGRVDVLVNNAGVFQFDPLEDVTEAEFHREFNTNVLGPILTIQEAVKHFPKAGGSVINVSSVASLSPAPMSSVYSATKGAVDAMTRALARELGPKNIRVNALNPGYTETDGVHSMGFAGTEGAQQMVANTPLGRPGQPEDIARVAVFLASADSAWMTGETVVASGGMR
jgi:3-oxoacyl-[acyl-carrier protein] reductase